VKPAPPRRKPKRSGTDEDKLHGQSFQAKNSELSDRNVGKMDNAKDWLTNQFQKRKQHMLCIYYSSIHAGNKNEKEQARKTTLLISRGLFELEREVIEKNNGIIAKSWQED